MQAGLRDIVTLLGVFGHLSAPTLAPPAAEVVEDTFAITRTLEVDCKIARNQTETFAIMDLVQETVTVARLQQEDVTIQQLKIEEVNIQQLKSEDFSVKQTKQQEFER